MTAVTTAVFMSGNSQAVRLPKQFQLKSKRVSITRRGDELVLKEVAPTMAEFLEQLPIVSDWPDIGAEGKADPTANW